MNTTSIVKATWATALAASCCLLAACASPEEKSENMGERVDKTMQNAQEKLADDRESAVKSLMDDKRAIARDLRDLRSDIDGRITKVEEKLDNKNLSSSERQEWREYRSELYAQRSRVEKALDDVTDADTDTWAETQRAVRQSTTEVGDWLRKEAEKIDRKTDADADKDGH